MTGEDDAKAYIKDVGGEGAIERLERLERLLGEENVRQNLVSAATMPFVWARHFADSAQLLAFGGDPSHPWIDLGTGGGFPGLVIAAMIPDREVILVEQRPLRTDWLVRAIKGLQLSNCSVRTQTVQSLPAMAVGTISARAFAPLSRLIQLASHLAGPDTTWVLPKGRGAKGEIAKLPEPARHMFHVEPSLTAADAGIIVGQGKVGV